MKRKLALTVVGTNPPRSAVKAGGSVELVLDLRDVFHHGYIDKHQMAPAKGTNPLFDEYAQLLVHGDPYLRFKAGGLAAGDFQASASHDLGRAFARAALCEWGYRWFAAVKDIERFPQRGWSIRRRQPGNMPDWLITASARTPPPALGEAKGTKVYVKSTAAIVHKWRTQVRNAIVHKNGIASAMKTWIVATRWVTSEQPKIVPSMYIEDPDIPGAELSDNDAPGLILAAATLHTYRNLMRLGLPRTAERVVASPEIREMLPRSKVITWRCEAPGLQALRFVGAPLGAPHGLVVPWWTWWLEGEWLWDLPRGRLRSLRNASLGQQWFDGLVIDVPRDLISNRIPGDLRVTRTEVHRTPGVHLLSDGSLIAPAELMTPEEPVEL